MPDIHRLLTLCPHLCKYLLQTERIIPAFSAKCCVPHYKHRLQSAEGTIRPAYFGNPDLVHESVPAFSLKWIVLQHYPLLC